MRPSGLPPTHGPVDAEAGVIAGDTLRQRAAASGPPRHILTVNAEEYFHGGALAGTISRKHWDRLESRLERSIDEVLRILERHGHTATFFVLGWSAERNPAVVRRIVEAGHEVASRGYWPRDVSGVSAEEFCRDLARTKEALVSAGAPEVAGFRSARWIRAKDLWILDVLAEQGYRYDASVNPLFHRFADDARFLVLHEARHSRSNGKIWEVPVSTAGLLGWRYAISGGNYLRQLPPWWMRRRVESWLSRRSAPLVFYFTPWEFDREQPRFAAVSALNHLRQYRNIEGAREVFENYFRRLQLCSIESYLALDARSEGQRSAATREDIWIRGCAPEAGGILEPAGRSPLPVSLVVPLFEEQATVVYLRRTLEGLRARSAGRYEWELVLVDDGSSDRTAAELERHFADWPGARIVRHPTNRGVAAAIRTGLRQARNEIVCSIDCDCSYDPLELLEMLPKLAEADLVTASPYHPEGGVFRVPRWRLFLSRRLSRLYSALLGGQLYTYTSCVRAYRRSAVESLELDHGGFLGIAELLVRLRLAGGRVVEHPAILEARLLGASKMRTLRTIWAHLGLLARLALRRGSLLGRSVRAAESRRAPSPACRLESAVATGVAPVRRSRPAAKDPLVA